jgi:hypothetical protein
MRCSNSIRRRLYSRPENFVRPATRTDSSSPKRRGSGARSRQAAQSRAAADPVLAAARAVAEQAIRPLPAPLQPWDAWGDGALSPVIGGLDDLYAGTVVSLDDGDLGDDAAFGSRPRCGVCTLLLASQAVTPGYGVQRRSRGPSVSR